jgi:hypothetical protein
MTWKIWFCNLALHKSPRMHGALICMCESLSVHAAAMMCYCRVNCFFGMCYQASRFIVGEEVIRFCDYIFQAVKYQHKFVI